MDETPEELDRIRALAEVRRRGWAQSAAEREPGVASVSAPVRDAKGVVIAAVSVSGPIDRAFEGKTSTAHIKARRLGACP